MGVYINNIEMPNLEHILIVYPSGRVMDCKVGVHKNIICKECEEGTAISVPDHGNLIERDSLPWYLKDVTEILEAPTIIPADRGYSCTQAQSPFGIRTETIEINNNRSADKENRE